MRLMPTKGWFRRTLIYLAAALAILAGMLVSHAMAQELIRPSLEHYMQAADVIAQQRAYEDLERLERVMARLLELERSAKAAEEARQRARERLVDEWAAVIQAQHGLLRQSIRPGTGWHEVTR